MKRILPVVLAGFLAACAGSDATLPTPEGGPSAALRARTVALGQSFEMRVAETVHVSGESLTVRFDAVPEDSRCPTGVQCVWAGNARVAVTLAKTGQPSASLSLNTNLEPRSGSYLDYTIELLGLAPYPSSKGGAISQSQYRATFVVRKAGPTLGQPFDLKQGTSATIAGEGLTVSFVSVPSDSRCPSDVNCFWEGNAEVQLTLSKPGYPTTTVVLNTTLEPKSASYAGYTVSLQGLAPYPKSTGTIDQSDYVTTLVVAKP